MSQPESFQRLLSSCQFWAKFLYVALLTRFLGQTFVCNDTFSPDARERVSTSVISSLPAAPRVTVNVETFEANELVATGDAFTFSRVVPVRRKGIFSAR